MMNRRFARLTVVSPDRTIGVAYVDLTGIPNAEVSSPLKYLVQIVHEQDITPGFTDVPLYGVSAADAQPVTADPPDAPPADTLTTLPSPPPAPPVTVPFDVSPAT
jgi:hypothetical protein